jgi:hypothetical protein
MLAIPISKYSYITYPMSVWEVVSVRKRLQSPQDMIKPKKHKDLYRLSIYPSNSLSSFLTFLFLIPSLSYFSAFNAWAWWKKRIFLREKLIAISRQRSKEILYLTTTLFTIQLFFPSYSYSWYAIWLQFKIRHLDKLWGSQSESWILCMYVCMCIRSGFFYSLKTLV